MKSSEVTDITANKKYKKSIDKTNTKCYYDLENKTWSFTSYLFPFPFSLQRETPRFRSLLLFLKMYSLTIWLSFDLRINLVALNNRCFVGRKTTGWSPYDTPWPRAISPYYKRVGSGSWSQDDRRAGNSFLGKTLVDLRIHRERACGWADKKSAGLQSLHSERLMAYWG